MSYLMNAWYMAALSGAITREPIKRVMLDQPLVLFRTEAGAAAALADRCPHRFAPLHKGKVKGDCIECPYHGLQFDATGACQSNPHGDHKIPILAKVRSYPVLERDGIVWAWMGDPALADASKAIDLGEFFGHGALTPVTGEYVLNAHYECVLDNLLDLSHAPFIHPTTLADPESIKNLRFEMKQEGNTVWAYHHVPNSPPSEQFKPFRQSAAPLCDTHAHMRWDPPGNLQLDVGVTELGQPDLAGQYLHFAHLITPIDMTHTRYAWIAARNFAPGHAQVSEIMQAQIELAFTQEDEPIIEAVDAYMGSPDLLSLSPVLLPGDAAGIRVRRILKQLKAAEAETSAAAVAA